MRRPRAVALALATSVAAVALLLVLATLAPREPRDEGGSAVAFRAGDRLVYADDATGTRVEIRALAPLMVRAADQRVAQGLPLLLAVEAADPRAWDAYVADLEHGGLAVSVDGCLLADVPCRDGSAATTYVSWQPCPLNALFSPLDVVPARDLQRNGELRVRDPVRGTTWTYRVLVDDASRALVTLADASEPRAHCGPAEELVVDLASARVERFRTGVGAFRLAAVHEGDGERVRLAGRAAHALPLVPPATERRGPFSAGFEEAGAREWTLEAAWRAARETSEPLAAWLAGHPDAFATSAANHTERARVGPVETRTEAWTLRLLAGDRTAMEVTARRTLALGVPRDEIAARHVPPPADAPERPAPPPSTGADASAIAAALRESGLLPEAALADAVLTATFDAQATTFRLSFPSAPPVTIGGALAQGAFVIVDATAGRVTDADLPRDRARAHLLPAEGVP